MTLESKQQEKQEGKCSSTTVNDTWHADNQQSKSDVRFTDEGFKSVDLNLPPLEVLLHRLQEMEVSWISQFSLFLFKSNSIFSTSHEGDWRAQ